MKKIILSIFFSTAALLMSAQTFTNTVGGAITDNNIYTLFPITVSGLPTQINTSSFGLEWVNINIVHPNNADLRIKLMAPNGTTFWGLNQLGLSSGANFTNTTFSDTASVLIGAGVAPYTGFFKPVDALALFNNTLNPNGIWYLEVRDANTGNIGSVINWSLHFGNHPAGGINFTSSNLPIVLISTGGITIPDNPKIGAWMGIIDNGPGVRNYLVDPHNNYNDSIGIEIRGSSSAGFPQKQYGIETRNTSGVVLDTNVLGMPPEHDWVLYAPYDDKTCMRNVLTYDLGNKMGHYAPRTRFCEVILNGQYQGIYVMMEKVKRDANRVNIAKLDSNDLAGDSLTGGYIIKIDKTTGTQTGGWNSSHLSVPSNHTIFIQYDYPGSSILPAQQAYIHSYVDSFETALSGPNFADPTIGFRKYIGEGSFIDYFIVNEISKNVDGYRLSSYFHKDKYSNGGKLKAGPLWDFNLAWWNANYCNGNLSTGWAYQFNTVCGSDGYQIPFWWDKLLQDPAYAAALKCRWNELRQTTLSTTTLNNYVDSIAAFLNEAEARHFTQWPILGVYTWPNPTPLATTYAGEITALKNWISTRMAWIDANLPGTCTPSVANFYTNHPVVCAGDSIKFHDNSSLYPTTWSWSFPGGSPSSSTLQDPKILYTTPGTYDVTLTVTNYAGTGAPLTMTNFVTINPLPVVTTPANIIVCNGASVPASAFNSSVAGTTYTWVNSDSTIGLPSGGTGNLNSFTAVNTTANPITAVITVTPTANACPGNPISYSITVNPIPVVNVNSASICQGSTASLTANGGTTYTWSAGTTSTGVNTANVTPAITTTYTVTGSTAGCSSTAVSTITVQPAITVTINSSTICSGQTASLTANGATSYTWSTGATSTGSNTANVSPMTTATYTVTGTDNLCSASAISTISVDPSITVSVNSSSVCTGQTANLVANGAASYTWSAGAAVTGTNTADVSPTTTTTYTVTGNSGVCSDTATSTVVVVSSLNVSVNSPTICAGQTANLIANGANNYTWSTGITSTGTNTGDAAPVTTTTYTVTGNSGSCSDTAIATVTVAAGVNVTVNSLTICAGQTANLVANGATTYTWSAGVTSTGANTGDASPTTTTTYTVTGNTGFCTGAAVATVTVDTLPTTPTITVISGNVLMSSSATGNQWYFNGSPIVAAIGQFYTMFSYGTYTLTVSNSLCTSSVSLPFVFSSVGIDALTTNNSIVIYPNPFTDNFSVDFYLQHASVISIEITDVLGRNIKTLEGKEFAEGKNNVEITFANGDLKEGIYFLKLISPEGILVNKITKMK